MGQGLNFDPFLDCASTLIDTLIAIDGTWSREGVVVAATYDASANDDVQGYAGLAFEFVDSDNVNVYSFVGASKTEGSDVSVGISGGISLFRSVTDIDGVVSFFAMKVPVLAALNVGGSYGFDSDCKISSMAISSGVSVDSPLVDVRIGTCVNAHRQYLTTLHSPDARSSAKTVVSHPEQSQQTVPQVMRPENGDNDESTAPQPTGGMDGGEYMLKLRFTSSKVIIALFILCAVLIVILYARCWNGKRKAHKAVVVDTDTEMEMADLNQV